MMRLCRRAALAALVLLALAGCQNLKGRDWLTPRVGLSDIGLGHLGLLEQELLLTLRVSNPNDRPVEIDYVRYDLALNGTAFGSATAGENVTVPANDQVQVPLTLPVATASLLDRLIDFGGRGVGYLLEGEIKYLQPALDLRPFQVEGRVEIGSLLGPNA